MCGTARRDARIAGNSVSSNAACHSASLVPSRSLPPARPTLLTRMSRPPNCSTVRGDDELDAGRRRDVGLNRGDHVRASCAAASTSTRRFGQPFVAARAEADAAAFGDERARAGKPQPAARAGDDGDFVGESEIHGSASSQSAR